MKKKGFTLVELLAVIILLSIVSLIATVRVLKYMNQTKDQLSKVEKQSLISSAENWSADNADLLPSSSEKSYKLEIDTLYTNGYLSETENTTYENYYVNITYENNKYKYEIISE